MSSIHKGSEPLHVNDEISIKGIILKVQSWIRFLFHHWLTIFYVSLIGCVIGIGISFFLKKKYIAELTFILEDANSNPFSAYMGIASQLGFDMGGGGTSSGIFSGDNIMEFLKSRLIVEQALLAPVTEDGHTTSLMDKYLDFTGTRIEWLNDSELKKIKFPPSADRRTFNIQQDSILNVVYQTIIKSNLKIEKSDPKLSFISVRVATPDELFSKVFAEQLVDEATAFYTDTKTRRSKISVERLQQQADSLEIALNNKTYAAAKQQDINLNPARQAAAVGTELVLRDKMVLQTMYAEVMKNLEISKLTMAQETPIIQIIDSPILPLKIERVGPVKGGIIGFIMGGFIIVVLLLTKRIFKEIMA